MFTGTSFYTWLDNTLPDECPPGVAAFCLNMWETVEGYAVEIIGASEYDSNDDDWACNELWTSRPSYFLIPPVDCEAGWEMCLEAIAEFVHSYIYDTRFAKRKLLYDSSAVAIGFVEGNLVLIHSVNDVKE